MSNFCQFVLNKFELPYQQIKLWETINDTGKLYSHRIPNEWNTGDTNSWFDSQRPQTAYNYWVLLRLCRFVYVSTEVYGPARLAAPTFPPPTTIVGRLSSHIYSYVRMTTELKPAAQIFFGDQMFCIRMAVKMQLRDVILFC